MDTTNGPLNRKLRMALVGGGQGAFIGRVHATAAVLDNRAELVAGALSSDPAKAKASAPSFDIKPDRAYGSFKELLDSEKKLGDDKRIDFVSVATPNHTHFEIAKAAVEAGFNVMCDKPMTFDLAQAEELLKAVEKSGVVFAVTHNYTGNPLVRQAREMILGGELGEIQAIRSNYMQGWLRTRLETTGQKQSAWRTDPSKSGAAGCFGDIGTHAYNLARYMTGLLPESVSAQLKIFEPGRQLDDYGLAVIKFENGALGTVTASQISHGRENDLFIEIDGTKGAIQWRQENPNCMTFRQNGKPHQTYFRDGGAPFATPLHSASVRIPAGHPEGYLEAFANVYRFAYDAMALRATGQKFEQKNSIYPNVYDGVEGMYFIQQCVNSSKDGGAWLPLKHPAARK
ncbi:MAG: Gfo/Idh/MocA family oxidoreductase [Planctomycetaceae bacterium]|nr:Gfo/Idh/MocA family oxidoreductase [Planctomycetaceae bacterium]